MQAPAAPLAGIRVFPINALPAAALSEKGIDEMSHSYEAKWRAVSRYYHEATPDLLFSFNDIVIQAEAMGAGILFAPDAMPAVKTTASQVRAPQAAEVERMRVNAQVVGSLVQEFPQRQVAGLVYGPFTVIGQLAGEQNVLRRVREVPRTLDGLLARATQVAQSYARLLLEAGAHVLWISDPLAALLPPECFEEFAGRYLRQVFATAQDGPTMLHICGDVTDLIEPMIASGTNGISFDQCMELLSIEDRVPPEVAVIGNLDPVEIVAMETPESVAAATRELATAMGAHPNFILSTGCALPPNTPLDNVRAFLDSGRRTLERVNRHAAHLAPLAQAVAQGDEDGAMELVRQGMAAGVDPLLMVQAGMVRSIRKASARYEAHQCYLPEILLMVDAFYRGMDLLRPEAPQGAEEVLLGTVQGDLHAIGKDLVRVMLEANGLGVRDLGVNVSADEFAQAVREHRPRIVGFSAFITSARLKLGPMIQQVRAAGGPELKVMVGGAAVNQAIAAEVGADAFAKEAVSAARLARRLLGREAA